MTTEQTEQILKMLGFANKARKLVIGMSATLNSVKKKKTLRIILATDISKNSENKLTSLATENNIPVTKCSSKKQFGDFFGREEVGIIGISDASFAKAIQKIVS